MTEQSRKIEEHTIQGLERYVSYAEILQAFPISKSTIERAWRGPHKDGEPRLPPPGKLRGRAVWPASVVNRWARQAFERQLSTLDRLAQSDPDRLAPEELAEVTFDLAARHLSQRAGQEVVPNQVIVGYTRPMTDDEAEAHLARLLHDFANPPFAHYELERAAYVAAHMFPVLRELWKVKAGMPQTAEQARGFALIASDDQAWAKLKASVGKVRRSAKPG